MIKLIVLKNILKDRKSYIKLYEKIYKRIIKDFNYRNELVKVEFFDKSIKRIKMSSLIVNLIFYYPFTKVNETPNADFFFDTNKISADTLDNYMDKIIKYFEDKIDYNTLCKYIGFIIEKLSEISLDFNMIIGNTINLYDKIQLAKRNKEYKDIINTKFKETDSSADIEKELAKRGKRLREILATEKNCFRDFIKSGEGVDPNQLIQFEVGIGPKPDLSGNVLPKFINSNFVNKGLQTVSDYYIDAMGGRKAAIINHSLTRKSGYLTRKLALLCINTVGDFDVEDCGTKHIVNIHVTEDLLTRLDKRYYVNDKNKLVLINADIDRNLIGTNISLRSPVTCCSKNGICKTCYGTLWKINHNKHIGILGTHILTSQLTQKMLSAKHLLKTNTKEIKWPEKFNEIFSIEGNTIFINSELENGNLYKLILNEKDFRDVDNDMGFDFDEVKIGKSIRRFKVKYKNNEYEFDIGKDFFLTDQLEKKIDLIGNKEDGIIEIGFKNIEMDETLFLIEIENNELSQHLYDIFKLIETTNEELPTYHYLYKRFLELIENSKIKINSVHIELIIREMVRCMNNYSKRPDFSTDKVPDYEIIRVPISIMNSSSLAIRLAFEKFKYQLSKTSIYKATSPSFLDELI